MNHQTVSPSRSLLALCTLLVVVTIAHSEPDERPERAVPPQAQKTGRPVRIVSLGFNGKSVAEISGVVDRKGELTILLVGAEGFVYAVK